jgi:hypothetical protein
MGLADARFVIQTLGPTTANVLIFLYALALRFHIEADQSSLFDEQICGHCPQHLNQFLQPWS